MKWEDLKREERVTQIINYGDFETWVKELFGQGEREYSVSAALECGNDTDHEARITGTHYAKGDDDQYSHIPGLSPYDMEALKKFIEFGEYDAYSPTPWVFLEYAVFQGHLPAGSYTIKVSW